MNEFSFNFIVDISGDRIDRYLSNKFPDFSRSIIKKNIKNGSVLVEGIRVKPSRVLNEGEQLIGSIKEEELIYNQPENIPLNILFEDEHFVAINKDPGLVVHPGNGKKNGTLVNALLYHFNNLSDINSIRPGIVHRLDKYTSGVIIIAKNNDAHVKMAKLFELRKVKKIYNAITWGKINLKGEIDLNICRNPSDRILYTTSKIKGRNALTIYTRDKYYPPLSIVRIRLKTGRTHQIRVHMQAIGHSIICDEDYSGGEKRIKSFHPKYYQLLKKIFNKINRVALHAELLEFIHPVNGQKMKIMAPLPNDMMDVLLILRESSEI